jgi:predicted permease
MTSLKIWFYYITPLLVFEGVNKLDSLENFSEKYLLFIISVILASVANIAFFSRERKITVKVVFRHLIISFFVGWIAYLLGINFKLSYQIRLIIVSLMAFLSEFFLKWLSEKYPKIFNRGLDTILPPKNNNNKDD